MVVVAMIFFPARLLFKIQNSAGTQPLSRIIYFVECGAVTIYTNVRGVSLSGID